MKITTEVFIQRAKEAHGNKYDYSITKYETAYKKVKIICRDHGVFEQLPFNHTKLKNGCNKCRIEKRRISVKQFVKRANVVHENKYDYSLIEYKNQNTKIKIICPEHGEFFQNPKNHLNGYGCVICSGNTLNKETFEKRSNAIHDNKYDYSLVEYKNNKTKVKIICKHHGPFYQSPSNHLRGANCPVCYGFGFDNKMFIEKAQKIHNNKYNYSKVIFTRMEDKVKIICPIHGEFHQVAGTHLKGSGCNACSYFIIADSLKKDLKTFIKESNKIHSNKYDYSISIYKNCYTRIEVICPLHGVFETLPKRHISDKSGCPSCNDFYDTTGPRKIKNFLNIYQIKFRKEKTFRSCINPRTGRRLKFDFYLPDYNMLIEYDGEQHFKATDFFGGKDEFEQLKYRDSQKNAWCENNNINLLRIPYFEFDKIDSILLDALNIQL